MSKVAEVYWCNECGKWSGLVGSYNARLEQYTCIDCMNSLETHVAVTATEHVRLECIEKAVNALLENGVVYDESCSFCSMEPIASYFEEHDEDCLVGKLIEALKGVK